MYNSGDFNFNNKESIKNILISHGYPVKDNNDYISTAAHWRGGQDETSVVVYIKDNFCVDFVDGSKFDIKKLISLVTNQISTEDLEKYLKNNNINLPPPSPKIKQSKIFPDEVLKDLVPIYDYWIKRGISENILIETGGGIYNNKGSLRNKFTFPILNSKNQIVGLAGRDVSGNNGEFKWILRGNKANWCYNAHLNNQDIKRKNSVFLLESIGDYLTFLECGIRNCIVLFGTELNLSIINYLLKINIGKIYISTNDDSKNNMAGNNAADKALKKLTKYFGRSQVKIVLPYKEKDWNEILIKYGKLEINEQLNKYN